MPKSPLNRGTCKKCHKWFFLEDLWTTEYMTDWKHLGLQCDDCLPAEIKVFMEKPMSGMKEMFDKDGKPYK